MPTLRLCACFLVVSACATPARPAADMSPSAPWHAAVPAEPRAVLVPARSSFVIAGGVIDEHGLPLAGVVVTAAGPTLQGTESAFTEDDGGYAIHGLPAGVYVVSFFWGDRRLDYRGVRVGPHAVSVVYAAISTTPDDEIVTVKEPLADDGRSPCDREAE